MRLPRFIAGFSFKDFLNKTGTTRKALLSRPRLCFKLLLNRIRKKFFAPHSASKHSIPSRALSYRTYTDKIVRANIGECPIANRSPRLTMPLDNL